MNDNKGTAKGWQSMTTAPRNQVPIQAVLANGEESTVMWARNGGWVVEFDRTDPFGMGGWLPLNEVSQPMKWKHFSPPRKSLDDPGYMESLRGAVRHAATY